MANEFTNTLKTAGEQILKYVEDAATLTVITRYIELGSGELDFEKAPAAAKTVIKMVDGDSFATIPMRKNKDGVLEVDTALFELHQQNVSTAIEYRANMLDALLQILKR